ncbi:MAG TPA: hypothetical protein DD671_15200, partial [Balneolaceae bacterium]|nr:hypothetical protein [Balneolaceae bacterium]
MKSEIYNWLKNLNTDKSNPWPDAVTNQAPHKPFLILSIIDGIEQDWITSNKITLSQDLIDTFFVYWNGIMGEERITSITLPYFYMKSEPFWELKYNKGENVYKNAPSLGGLQKRVEYAVIDTQLFSLLNDKATRDEVRSVITNHYFDTETAERISELSSFNYDANQYGKQLELLTENEFKSHYSDKGKTKVATVNRQIRDKAFSNNVRKNYNYNCSVCKSKVVTPTESYLVEGAHIIPWSESYNDDPRNGISLCRNHHWLFDRFMLTIRDDYSIEFSPWLSKKQNNWDELETISGSKILLPKSASHYPAGEALAYHNEEFEKFH